MTQYYGPGFAEREHWLEFGIYFQTEELVEYCLREVDPKTILRDPEIGRQATNSKNLRVLKWLAERGYDPNLPASGYGTILDMARTMKWQEGERFIESWMKDYGSPSPKGS